MRLPVLIFDFGNVLCRFDSNLMYARLGRRFGLDAADLERRLIDRGAAALSRRFELGRLSPREFATQFLAMAGFDMPFEEFQSSWPDIFELNEPVARLVGALKRQGYALLLGSNTNALHADFFRHKYHDAISHFDCLMFSYELGVMKPEREFFDACARKAGVQGSDCVFIDDAPANVAGAQAAGLRGILYLDPAQLVADLGRLGVEIGDAEG